MALTSVDLLQPKGDITPDWFPTLDDAGVATLLDGYLADATARIPDTITDATAIDNAARAWAMGRAWRNVQQRLINAPATLKLDGEGSQSIIGEQIKNARQLAEKFEAEFEELTDVADSGSTVDDAGMGAAINRYVW